MVQLVAGTVGVQVDEDADHPRHGAVDVDLGRAQEGHGPEAEGARGGRGEGGAHVGGRGEEHRDEIGVRHPVALEEGPRSSIVRAPTCSTVSASTVVAPRSARTACGTRAAY